MTPIFYNNQNEFREWLEKNHQSETELWTRYYKVETGKSSMTWSQSVDQDFPPGEAHCRERGAEAPFLT